MRLFLLGGNPNLRNVKSKLAETGWGGRERLKPPFLLAKISRFIERNLSRLKAYSFNVCAKKHVFPYLGGAKIIVITVFLLNSVDKVV